LYQEKSGIPGRRHSLKATTTQHPVDQKRPPIIVWNNERWRGPFSTAEKNVDRSRTQQAIEISAAFYFPIKFVKVKIESVEGHDEISSTRKFVDL
jgi:hypothetical protein